MRLLQTDSSRHPRPRGSVLIFAIVLLSILAMLGTAFLLSVRQSSKASTSVLTNQQDEIVAKSGLEIALRTLRSSVLRYTICTDRAVFDTTNAPLSYSVQPSTDAEVIAKTAPDISPLCQFRGFDKTGSRGLLSLTDYNGDTWNYSGPHYTTEMLGGTRIPTGTTIPAGIPSAGTQPATPASMLHIEIGTELVIDTAPNDETVVVQDVDVAHTFFTANFALPHGPNVQIGVLDFARRNTISGSVGDFYLPVANANVKELGHLRTTVVVNATGTINSADLTGVSSTTGVYISASVNGVGVPANTYVVAFSGTTITLNNLVTVSSTGPFTIGGIRGEYYTWITDMDAKFYAVLQDWGVDNLGTDPLYSGISNSTIRQNVLKSLGVLSDADISYLDSLSPAPVINDSRYPVVRSNSELALNMPSTNGTAPSLAYEKARNTLDTYITPYKDPAEFALPLNLKFCKDWSTAININTAPLEVIAAALSQIPGDDRSTFPTVPTPPPPPGTLPLGSIYPSAAYPGVSLAEFLARRIVAKRPFLCRMDFEDFMAAQIMGTAGSDFDLPNSNDNSPDDTINPYLEHGVAGSGQVIPVDTDPMWFDRSSTYWSDNAPVPIAYLVYFMIGRRFGPGNTSFGFNVTVPPASDLNIDIYNQNTKATTLPELTLSQYLEIPGVSESHPVFKNANTPTFQKARFRFFFGNKNERLNMVTVEKSLITVKEFNNIVNSVTSIYQNNDQQTVFPDRNTIVSAATIVVTPDASGMSTTPQGDDQYVFDASNKIVGINAGPNGIPETWVSANRPSYYSYFNDILYADRLWFTINKALDDNAHATPTPAPSFFSATSLLQPELINIKVIDPASPYVGVTIGELLGVGAAAHTGPVNQLKFFYMFRVQPGSVGPPIKPPTLEDIEVTDLMYWRCRPYNWQTLNMPTAPTVAIPTTDGRAGFYQMSFDDWSTHCSTITYPKSLGFVQATADPEDTDFSYSTAGPTSGTKGNGDANWSPQFAFRSRYYGVYVLGRGLLQGATVPRSLGERRLEAVYDALKDEVLWQRSQLSDKRSLGD